MSKDLASSKKICKRCGEEILEGQAYLAIADNFKVGEENTVDLLTKAYTWSTYHDTTSPSRTSVVCEPIEKGSIDELKR